MGGADLLFINTQFTLRNYGYRLVHRVACLLFSLQLSLLLIAPEDGQTELIRVIGYIPR